MKVAIRVDAGLHIGIGHVMRCMALADKLRLCGHVTYFITREHRGNIIDIMVGHGHEVLVLPVVQCSAKATDGMDYVEWLGVDWVTDVQQTMKVLAKMEMLDWLIIDHYGIDARWENKASSCVNKILVIDDLADRLHDCHIIIDQNLYSDMAYRYDNYVPMNCKKLMGPKYAMLSADFSRLSKSPASRSGTVRNIHVFFGGADKTNETSKVLEALKILNLSNVTYDVVVGVSNPNRDSIKSKCEKLDNANYYCQIDNMSEMMSKADLVLGAGGISTWERCALGLPAIIVAVVSHQEKIAEAAHQVGAVKYLGNSADVDVARWVAEISSLLDSTNELKRMTEQGKLLVDGRGVDRIIGAMEAMP